MKRVILAAGLLAALGFMAQEASAQSGAVRGKIVDDKGQPLVDAKLAIEYQGSLTRKYETKTNKRGEYTQVGLQVGDYKITATKEGYQGSYVTLRVGLGEPVQVPEMKLVPAAVAQAAAGGGGPTQAQISADFKAAYDLLQQGQLDAAEAAYKAILVKTPDIPEVYFNLGHIAEKRKDHAAAEAAYTKALAIKPGYADAIIELAEVYQSSGQGDKATELVNKATTDFADDAAVLYQAGAYHFNGGRSTEALALFKKVAELDPAHAEVHYFLGSLSIGQNDVAAAKTHFEKYLAGPAANPQFKATAQGLLAYLNKPK
jgi:tetratricopeptide (TPR) repeat protein